MTVRQAERDAAQLLASSWWSDARLDGPLPVDPLRLARALGLDVRTVPLPSDESGNIVIPPDGTDERPVINLNAWDHPNRQRFTCAHEIGHYLRRQHRGDRARTFVDYRDTLAGLGTDAEEIYANQFAAALLMPAHLVKQLYADQGQPVEVLAARFGTSVQAVNVRLRNLRLA